jgi:aspartate/tyrosine/aromatic aminotransferase
MIKSFGYEAATYRYYDLNKRKFEFESMVEDLKKIPE